MSNNNIIESANTFKMECPVFKVGELVSIWEWQGGGLTNRGINSGSHILVYWGPKKQEFVALQDSQQYKIVDIRPIGPQYSSSFYDQINMEAKNTHNFLERLQRQLIHICVGQCQKTNEIQPQGVWLFCDISACCYVLVAQEGVQWNTWMEETEVSPKEQAPESLSGITALRNMLEYNENILRYNKHHCEYLNLIDKALDLEADIPERQDEGIAFAWLLANTERSETALRFLKSSGEINDFEEYDVKNVRDTRFSLLKSFANRFMEQASSPAYKNLIWAVLNFTMFLLELAIDPYHLKTEAETFDDFMGMYPIIMEDDESGAALNTVSPIQYTPLFAYTFLCIPPYLKYRFSGYLRQLLHEFFHYVPTDTRQDRNELILKMFGYSVLGEEATPDCVDELSGFLLYHYKRLGHETTLFKDSMSFISIMRVVLNRVDIAEYLKSQGYFCDCCEFPTKSEQIDILMNYTFFLREIRSDISMAKLLNASEDKGYLMDLRNYIRLMANESNWALLPAKEASIDSILRFGFMTHWLSRGSEDPDIIQKEIEMQREEYPTLDQEYGNLIDYLEEYKKEIKIFESCDSKLKELTSKWSDEDESLNRIIGNDRTVPRSFWKDFISLYENADFDEDNYSYKTAQKDFGVMLLLLNLPYYKKYYLDYNTDG